ncbi:MAG: hypothetical protein ABI683_03335 [Ginsengibacter sp.]
MKIVIGIAAVFALTGFETRTDNSRDLLKQMHDRYAGKWYKTFSFSQTTGMYKNDTLRKTETWYEHVRFPADFRIDFGNPDSGNAVIFKNDSAYFFKNTKHADTRANKNDLTFLLGGLYFYSFDDVIDKFKSLGYDLDKFHADNWKGQPVYVIGAGKGEESINQLWIDKENFNLVRMIKFEDGQKEEAFFEDHVKLDNGYSESAVRFYINNELVQVEKYHEMKVNVKPEESIFDPVNFIKLPRASY